MVIVIIFPSTPNCHFDSNSFATLLRNLSLLRLSIPSQDSSKAQSKATIGMTRHTRFFPCSSLEQDRGETLHTFFLNDQKESVQRKSRRHRFIGQFLLYTNGVNLNTLSTLAFLLYGFFIITSCADSKAPP